MKRHVGNDRTTGIDRVWALTAEGYRIVDVDSDEHFVGIRMERGDRVLTLLLTRVDFARAFPGAASWADGPEEPDRAPRRAPNLVSD